MKFFMGTFSSDSGKKRGVFLFEDGGGDSLLALSNADQLMRLV